MPTTKIATLGSIGWVDSIPEKGDYAISCFITTNKSQSVEYAGNITSLQYLVKTYANAPRDLETNVRTALERTMSQYFGADVAQVTCTVELDTDDITKITIRFRCVLTIDGSNYVLGRIVQYVNGRLVAIAKDNNG
jgi:hypothetical protein